VSSRREFITLLGGSAALLPLPLSAQQPASGFQVGYLYPGTQAAVASRVAAFRSGLQAGGVRADQVSVIVRVADGDLRLLAPLAVDLVGRKVDLIQATGPAAVRAARAATTTVPIVAGDLESDPIGSGFIVSNAHPGGNITGTFLDFPDFSKKWLESLKEAVPQATNVAVFWDAATGPAQLRAVEAAAPVLGLKLIVLEVQKPAEFEGAFKATKQQDAGALVILSSPLVGGNTKLLADLALTHRLPAVTLFSEFARDGGLMAYGPNLLTFIRQQGVMAAKILQGMSPAELPIETPTRFEFVLNLKTAAVLNIVVPPSILLRADEVIE
jgi:putative tryptophan/tyrosine transport system substrate-binding protein